MSDARKASDDLLVQLIREGRHDAEIAIRLGITTGELRERKAALRGKLGDEKYLKAVDATAPRKANRRRRRLILLALGVVGAFGLLLVIANLVVDDGEEIAAVRVVPSPTARPTPRQPSTITVGTERFDDAGPFLSLAEKSELPYVGGVENRAGLTVVRLHDKAYISPNEVAQWTLWTGGGRQVRVRALDLGGRAVTLVLNAGDSATRIRSLPGDIGPIAEIASQVSVIEPVLLIRAYDDSGRQLQTQVTVDGDLHVARTPIPGSWVIERATGARIDVEGGTVMAQLSMSPGVSSSTFCRPIGGTLRCGVTWTNAQGLNVTSQGTLSCTGPTSLRFEANGIRLDFSQGVAITSGNPLRCEEGPLLPETRMISGGDWEVLASTVDGAPISVAVSKDGLVTAGAFNLELSCPCLAQP